MLWIKALHIISAVCWFAALFYLPRLFVYHAMSEDKISRDRFEMMEQKLYRIIGTPAMIATLVFGAWYAYANYSYYLSSGWFHAKLTLVFILIGYHHMCARHIKQFKAGEGIKSHRYFRWFNEFPVLLLVGIVVLASVKPF